LGFEPLEDRRMLSVVGFDAKPITEEPEAVSAVVYVDADATGDDNGTNWADAYSDLQDALSVAAAGDEIRVAQGIYAPAGPGGDRAATFRLLDGAALVGGYAGVGEPDPNTRDVSAFETILSGDLNGDDGPHFVGNDENSYHVVDGSGTGATTVLDGFTITAGNANGEAWADARGGGLFNHSGHFAISNCTLVANTAEGAAGAMWNYSSAPMVTDCAFLGNTTRYNGGAVFNNFGGETTFVNCSFVNNTAGASGGAVNNGSRSEVTLVSCAFIGNSAAYHGGAVSSGGYCDVTSTNCTFVANTADIAAGGMHNGIRSDTTLTNCLFWNNWDPHGTGESAQIDGGEPVVNASCIQGWTGILGGSGNLSDYPLFVDADGADNVPGNADDNLRLLAGSPCIDVGDNSALPPSVTVDLDGNPRVVDGVVDMGAYEGPKQGILLSPLALTIAEGSTATFTVKLAADPQQQVRVTIAHHAGDPDVTVQSATQLTFDSANYTTPQTVTLAAAQDPDNIDGTAVFSLSTGGCPTVEVCAFEADDEPVTSVLFVDDDAPGANTGSSWAGAYNDLQVALDIAASHSWVEEIRVAQGTYAPAQGPGDREATFQLVDGVAVRGGYAGFGAPDPDARHVDAYLTVLSGDLAGDDGPQLANNGENSLHVVTTASGGTTEVLDGFTITGGNADGSLYSREYGGGMYARSSVTVIDCTLTGNSAVYGAGMYLGPSDCCVTSPTLIDCTFTENSAQNQGGGLWIGDSDATMINCMIRGNSAGGHGGGMMFGNDTFSRLVNCVIGGNTAGDDGGGIYAVFAFTTSLTNCTVSGNSAANRGAGLFSDYDCAMTLDNSIFWGNTDAGGTDESAQIDYEPGQEPAVNHSCVQGWTGSLGGTGNIGADPQFVDPAAGDYRVLPRSPCVDAGDNSAVPASVVTDMDGNPRILGPAVDMGAYEATSAPLPVDRFELSPIDTPQAVDVPFDVTVRATDAEGRTEDDFYGRVELSGWISEGVIPTVLISELGVNSPETVESYQRIGDTDHDNASDWVIAPSNLGSVHPNMTVPFAEDIVEIAITPTAVTLAEGVWTGEITVLEEAAAMFLRADDAVGHHGQSNRFDARADLGEIHGRKFHDLDGDGLQGTGEPALPEWKIYLDENGNGQWDDEERFTLTDDNGDYAFAKLVPGQYRIGEVVRDGWEQTFPNTGPSGIRRVSVSDNATQGDGNSETVQISADGRYVAFSSYARTLVPPDSNSKDVFVYDRETETIERVSLAPDGSEANAASLDPSISADGRFVVFSSYATNLVPGDTNGSEDVFVYDRKTDTIERVSVASDGTQGNGQGDNCTISPDGRYVGFRSGASNLVPGLTRGSVFVHDRQTGTTECVSMAFDGSPPDDTSRYPSLSVDGRYVAFSSDASNLVPGDNNHEEDVFVYDRQTGTMRRASTAFDGLQGNDVSWRPSLSADGLYVAFEADASNLVPGDSNGRSDVFVRPAMEVGVFGAHVVFVGPGQVVQGVDFGNRHGDAPLIVSTTVDENDGDYGPGDLSLREALTLAAGLPGDDVIEFHDSLIGGTILLDATLGQLVIDSNVDVLGPGADRLTVDAEENSRVFHVGSGGIASIAGLTITGGWAEDTSGGPAAAGGGILNLGTLTLDGAVLTGNYAGGGGGVCNFGTAILTDVTVSGNSAREGGGIANYDPGVMTVTGSVISQNTIDGGIRNHGDLTLRAVTIADNEGSGITNEGPLTVADSTISGNTTTGAGGGLQNYRHPLTVTNTTISGNTSQYRGGGLYINGGSALLVNVTVANNRALDDGGGIFRYDRHGALVTLHNTIVAGNFRVSEGERNDVAGELDAASSHNLIGSAGLGPLADNGGPTLTHAVGRGSAALDAGSNARADDAGLTADQRGFDRFLDGDGDGVVTVDIGAYESHGPVLHVEGHTQFDGQDDYLQIEDRPELNVNQYSIAFWFRADAPDDGTQALIARGEDWANDKAQWVVELNDRKNRGKVQLWYEDAKDKDHYFPTAATIQPDTWYHFAATRSEAGDVTIYLNGQVELQATALSAPASVQTPITVGARRNSPHRLQDYFNGAIHEAFVYDRVLSADEVAGLLANTRPLPGPVLDLPGPVEFDGEDDYLAIAGPALNVQTYTIAFGFQADVPSAGTQALIARGEDWAGDKAQWVVELNDRNARGRLQLWYEEADDRDHYFAAPTTIEADTWYHAVFTRSAEGMVRIYLDGQQVHQELDAASPATVDTPVLIGARTNQPGRIQDHFHGTIADVQIYNYAMTPVQVLKIIPPPRFELLEPVDGQAFQDGQIDLSSRTYRPPTKLPYSLIYSDSTTAEALKKWDRLPAHIRKTWGKTVCQGCLSQFFNNLAAVRTQYNTRIWHDWQELGPNNRGGNGDDAGAPYDGNWSTAPAYHNGAGPWLTSVAGTYAKSLEEAVWSDVQLLEDAIERTIDIAPGTPAGTEWKSMAISARRWRPAPA